MLEKLKNELVASLGSMSETFLTAVPKIIGALVIFVIFWIVAKVLSGIVVKVCKFLKVDQYASKLKEVEIFSKMDFPITNFLGKIVYYMILLSGVIAGADALGIEQISSGIKSILGHVPNLLVAGIFFLIGTFIANVIREFILSATASMNLSSGKIIANAIFYFITLMVIIMSLNQAGIGTELLSNNIQIILTVVLAALGLGFALSSGGLMTNLIGSFYAKNKFEVGQSISVGDVKGKVVASDSTSVTLEEGGRKIIVPMAEVAKSRIELH